MGIYAAMFRFPGPPPSLEEINRKLRVQVGEHGKLAGYRVEGVDLLIYTSPDAIAPAYAAKVLRGLGGAQVDIGSREPLDLHLPSFVEKPWLEHDEATRHAILLAFEQQVRQRE